MIAQKTLEFRDTQIAYYMEEQQDKETILMLHPAFADHQIFEAQTDDFKQQYQVILIDMPGHGASQIKGSAVTLKDMPEIIDHLMSTLHIRKLHVMGVSLGSLLAQAFADRYPERVQSVTIVGGYSIHRGNEQILKKQRREGLKWIFHMLLPMDKFRDHVTSVSCYTKRGREVFRRGCGRFTRRSFTAMTGMNSLFTKKETPVRYPLLIVTGEHDLQIVQDAGMQLHQAEKNSQFALLPEAGHCVNIDAPVEFNRIVQEFWSRNSVHSS